MFSGETVELLKKISDSHIEMTSKFLNASLDNLNKTNSVLFKSDLIDGLKDKINKTYDQGLQSLKQLLEASS